MNDKITRGSTWSICFKFKPEQLVKSVITSTKKQTVGNLPYMPVTAKQMELSACMM